MPADEPVSGELLQGVVVGDTLHVSYTRDRKGALTATTVAPQA